jgi:hypothetical protein
MRENRFRSSESNSVPTRCKFVYFLNASILKQLNTESSSERDHQNALKGGKRGGDTDGVWYVAMVYWLATRGAEIKLCGSIPTFNRNFSITYKAKATNYSSKLN